MQKNTAVIVGVTGLVGTTLLHLLEEKKIPLDELHLVASEQSAGKSLSFRGEKIVIEDLATFDFSRTKIAFFCVSNQLAEMYAPKAAAAGNKVIDKSSFYRYHPDVPLVVPEVNPLHLKQAKLNIIASPNCSTIPLAVALKPIYDKVGITRINVTTFQSVSGTGKEAVQELTLQTKQLLANEPIKPHVYPQQIAFNVLPHIDSFEENDYTREEMKIVWEMRKIFNDDNLAVNPTAVRVPVICGHSAAVHVETRDKITVKEASALLSATKGITFMADHQYPTPACDAAGHDEVFVGRLREDISHPRGLNLWVVADNLRKGAALNALQIADLLMKDG